MKENQSYANEPELRDIGLEPTAHRLVVWRFTYSGNRAQLEKLSSHVATQDLLEPKIEQRYKCHLALIDNLI